MTKRHVPPVLNSKVCVVVVNPFGPHHCARCFGSVNAENTRSRGASKTRVPMIECGSRSRSMLLFAAMIFLPLALFLRGLQRLQVIIETIEPLFPKPPVFFE